MPIPKTIHYCWFGRNPKPELAEKCINSWKRKCPNYEIIEWNEDNFDISACPLYVRQAYEAKKWAFVTDYVRLAVVYEHGGIYLDTDVELKKCLDSLLQYNAYFGFEGGVYINTGLGFGAVAGCPILKEMMDDYEHISFLLESGDFDHTPCPQRNTEVFLRHGLKQDDSIQMLDGNVCVLPTIYLCPIDYRIGRRRRSRKTISIHWFTASWTTEEEKIQHKKRLKERRKWKRKETADYIVHIPNRIMISVLGIKQYEKIKKKLRGRF